MREFFCLFSTAVSFRGHLGANYLEFEWFVPKTRLEFEKGQGPPLSGRPHLFSRECSAERQ